ncbi:hypothetical protein WN73_19100 [Bradyrhizobium sp. CCBAU 45394]|nr:hypothetical protein [Bradyrhizobium sp. CCBAU 45394]
MLDNVEALSMPVITPEEFERQLAMANTLEEARELLLTDLKAATPRDFRSLPVDSDDSRRSKFAETILVHFWKVEARGNPTLKKTQEQCAELLRQFRDARGRIGSLIAEWSEAGRPGYH